VQAGLAELPKSRIVFATDYPQGVQDDEQVTGYVEAVRAGGGKALPQALAYNFIGVGLARSARY
jgi:hypothetical protein